MLTPLPGICHSLTGAVLSILIGFRTNQSYERFWEGRRLWGQVFSTSRGLARVAICYVDSNPELYETIVRLLKAFPIALKQHLLVAVASRRNPETYVVSRQH